MRVFSGIQPTGQLHIGNYLGAIKQWLELQEKEECIFCIVDWHAITVPYEKGTFQKTILNKAIEYLACGVDPEKSIMFVQSHVKEHAELAWLLNTICPIGELSRMTQYKEKAKRFRKGVSAGLLNYPVLMAADILLYKTDLVPVGKDQQQHVELARFLACRFNKRFGQTFQVPKLLLPKVGQKIMSLTDPKEKMSKSLPSSCLFLTDTPEEIQEKIMTAVTDPGRKIAYNPEKKPGISNLLTIYSLFSGQSIKELEKKFKGKGYQEFKKSLVKVLVNSLEPFRRKRKELLKREVYVKEILDRGKNRAKSIASSTMEEVRKKMALS